ncbi:sialate O-acetylesterase [Dinghuibacter silviterrae]|uniref:Sialate O-acetylesterase n=1 Tax=Dinghuibacter silviterrae TaxID=1539049 RepID=A0A4R8DFF9_9BACT|nr:sialate O-acetylesterase [Dinghuibacter silviterrae]TDW96329.1 sialate O-acetylesterase [Dinghuibacter silviterrae]
MKKILFPILALLMISPVLPGAVRPPRRGELAPPRGPHGPAAAARGSQPATRRADGLRPAVTLTLAIVLQDNMVIQQNKPFKVWGAAPAGTTVEIQADWMSNPVTVIADRSDTFLGIIDVPRVAPGDYKPHTLTVRAGASVITLHNVLVGEVWFCSGQSNMQFSMITVLDSTSEIAAADHPSIRLFNTALNFSDHPLENVKGKWVPCSPETVKGFSAVAYYFGRKLQETLNVPVGLIFSGIGASAAQAYVPEEALAADTQLNRVYLQPYLSSPRSKEVIDGGFSFEKVTRPFLLYNALIHPFRHLSIRGICWYQGESNRMERDSYTRLTQTLVRCWRTGFAQGDLPFYYVQVAPYFYDKEDPTLADYAFFREAQERISDLDHTAMVVTMDVGESKNLHPINKKPVGERLAATALAGTYGLEGIVHSGPHYQCMEVRGRDVVIHFEPGTLSGGLKTIDGGAPLFFTMAGADKVFYPAVATIEGDHVVLHSDKVRKPLAARYAFTNYPVTNLENGAGWPAVPFRTDDWVEK